MKLPRVVQCKKSPTGKHQIKHESYTDKGLTTSVFYCTHCGLVDHKMTKKAHR